MVMTTRLRSSSFADESTRGGATHLEPRLAALLELGSMPIEERHGTVGDLGDRSEQISDVLGQAAAHLTRSELGQRRLAEAAQLEHALRVHKRLHFFQLVKHETPLRRLLEVVGAHVRHELRERALVTQFAPRRLALGKRLCEIIDALHGRNAQTRNQFGVAGAIAEHVRVDVGRLLLQQARNVGRRGRRDFRQSPDQALQLGADQIAAPTLDVIELCVKEGRSVVDE